MKPSSSSKKQQEFHKYLKPGALARLRDSKISARSQSINDESAMTRMLESALSGRDEAVRRRVFDEAPEFLSYGGARCLRRKKLVAANSILFIESRDSDVLVH